jgi:hypothetical protein
MSIRKKGRDSLLRVMKGILEKEGFSIEWVNARSFWEIEEDCHLRHYRVYPGDSRRVEEEIRYLMGCP